MIYFDNAATTLQKPPGVAEAVAGAIGTLGNAGRSFYDPAMQAARAVYAARAGVARLVRLKNPMGVAFTASATESLNLVIAGLLGPGDHAITTVLEHNSVLRPLYRCGCGLSFLGCDEEGRLALEALPGLVQRNTKCVVATHGSNLLGTVTDTVVLRQFCQERGLLLVLDTAQTLGQWPVEADMADILCFTGHKSLFGPQGTGGVIAAGAPPLRVVKTGGTGTDTFAPVQPATLPDAFEAGTHNAHALAGLTEGLRFIADTGLPAIVAKEAALTQRFLASVAALPNLRVYGPLAGPRLPVVALNIGALPSEEVALRLWETAGLCTRPGSHCAPLAHRRFGTEGQGMVRFSFGWFNTEAEIDAGVAALAAIAQSNLS